MGRLGRLPDGVWGVFGDFWVVLGYFRDVFGDFGASWADLKSMLSLLVREKEANMRPT